MTTNQSEDEGLRDELVIMYFNLLTKGKSLAESSKIPDKELEKGEAFIDDLMALISQKILEARMDENAKWKVVAEEIVEKDGVYRAVNYLNQRITTLTQGIKE